MILNSRHLLDQAERLLARRSPKLTVIRQADRRRAISSAYYAVFHHVLTSIGDRFVGGAKRRTPIYSLAYRSIDHIRLEALCRVVGSEKIDQKSKYAVFSPEGGFHPNLREYATKLIDLKKKRNIADYDPSHWIRIADVRTDIAAAREAIEQFTNTPDDQKELFLTLLAFPPR